MLPLLLTGILSILAQVVVLRELSVASFGVELVAIVALGAWLLGSALGAASDPLFERLVPRSAGEGAAQAAAPPDHSSGGWPMRTSWLLPGALGLAVVPAVALVRAGRVLFGGVPGAYLPIGSQAVLLGLATLPVAGLAGLSFQWSARLRCDRGGTLAGAYAVESVGALVAGVATTTLLRAGASTFALALACGWIGAVAFAFGCASRPRRRVAVVVTGVLAAAGCLAGPALDARLTRIDHPALLVSRDTPYTRVTIEGGGPQTSFFADDGLVFTTGDVEPEVLAHLVLLQHPAPRRVLSLGGAIEGVPQEALAHGASSVTVAEIDRRMLDVVLPFAAAGARRSIEAGTVRLVVGDPRQVLDRSGRVDAILVAMPEPVSGAANRFYTREFFEACRARLEPAGVMGLKLRVSENTWRPVERARVASVHAAMRAVFPHVAVLPTPSTLVIAAGRAPLPPLDVLLARMGERRLRARLVTTQFVRYVYDNDRREEAERFLAASDAPANSDAAPAAFRDAMVQWIGRFWPRAAAWEPGRAARDAGGWLLLLASLAVVSAAWIVRRSPGRRRLAIVLVAGFLGMLLEAVVLLHYQVTRGVLFVDLGLLLTGFMGGLTIGAAAAARWLSDGLAGRTPARVLLAALGVVSAGVAVSIGSGTGASLAASSLALAAIGVGVGALFGWASAPEPGRPGTTPGFYAADLLGGCVGAVVGGLVLIPFGGLALTAWLAAAVAALAIALA